MLPVVASLNYYLALGTIALHVIIAVVVIAYVMRSHPLASRLLATLRTYAYFIGFVGAFGASFMTLLYSDYFGFIPCGLCWFERILLYPQVVVLGIAWWKGDENSWRYVIVLSLIGLFVALYHHYIQIGGADFIPCPASGEGDCGKRILYEFGYVTYPLMAALIFAWHAVLGFVVLKK